ncbi:MAG: aminoglycoside phosphotransferase family protein [Bacteroidota bacterium]
MVGNKTNELKGIFDAFDHGTQFMGFKELTSGHINDTYLIETSQKPYYILQRINHNIFKDVPGLVQNKVYVSEHIKNKLRHLPANILQRKVLTFIPVNENKLYYLQQNETYWNLMVFIDDSLTYETVKDKEIAYEGGLLLGEFLNLTSDFDAAKLTEVIPKFHDMSYRFEQFDQAMKKASSDRLKQADIYIKKINDLKDEMHILQNLKESGQIPLRVTHNDTKISNTLFDKNQKGLCIIDTDTVMPGIVHYDFGDAIRTICNTAAEDEKNLDKVHFNFTFYKAYLKGFLGEMEDSLNEIELKYLPLAAKTMIFIMGLRFLTDYLNNDIYYKTAYTDHNLVRAKNQFKLIDSLMEVYDEMCDLVKPN